MKSPLSYFLILNQAGLPLYAQSFQFDSDEACRSFENRIDSGNVEGDQILIGSYFSAMQMFASDVLKSQLNLYGLGFTNFKIEGIVRHEINFIGIFQFEDDENVNDNKKLLQSISEEFFLMYSLDDINQDIVESNKFDGFTDKIMSLFDGGISTQNCRNCLQKCTDEHKGCMPHLFYFNKIDVENNGDSINMNIVGND